MASGGLGPAAGFAALGLLCRGGESGPGLGQAPAAGLALAVIDAPQLDGDLAGGGGDGGERESRLDGDRPWAGCAVAGSAFHVSSVNTPSDSYLPAVNPRRARGTTAIVPSAAVRTWTSAW